jgi:hypothetical protein
VTLDTILVLRVEGIKEVIQFVAGRVFTGADRRKAFQEQFAAESVVGKKGVCVADFAVLPFFPQQFRCDPKGFGVDKELVGVWQLYWSSALVGHYE